MSYVPPKRKKAVILIKGRISSLKNGPTDDTAKYTVCIEGEDGHEQSFDFVTGKTNSYMLVGCQVEMYLLPKRRGELEAWLQEE